MPSKAMEKCTVSHFFAHGVHLQHWEL